MQGPGFINFEGHIRTVKYRVDEVLKKWLRDWSFVLDGQNFKIDIKWENDSAIQGYRLKVYVNNWVTQYIVDNQIFDYINKDIHYVEYLGEQVLRCSQTGIITNWIETVMDKEEDQYDLGKMWREDLSKMAEECHFQRTPRLGKKPEYYDLVHLLLNDYPVPVTLTIKEVVEEPKLLLARLTMMKK